MKKNLKKEVEYLNYKDASILTGLPIGSLYSKVCKKQIPHHRFGGRCVRFCAEELLAWIESKKVEVENGI